MERLFDSLMRDYPIGSFLFWMVKRKQTAKYQFYEFVRDYHERDNPHNAKANVNGQDDVTGILDGQQRLTALYVGLRGSFAYKEPHKRWENPQAFPKRRLYLNLRARANDETRDLVYDFRFLTDKEAQVVTSEVYWFEVSGILDLKNPYHVNSLLIERALMDGDKERAQFANETLFKLWSVVHEQHIINYFLEQDERLDKVLNIFIRVNSGGTILSYSDLLLSIAAAQWSKIDARETITGFVDELNGIGNGFDFDKDWVLKSCLVLGDFNDIAFKVDNFNKANMSRIEGLWDEISQALRSAVILVSAFGYARDTLTSNNAVIPIAYHILQRGLPSNFDQSAKYNSDRLKIRQLLLHSLLKRIFGGQPDNVLRPMREVLKGVKQTFPLEDIREKLKRTPKSLTFTTDDIEALIHTKYGKGYTFSTLALLYPALDFRNSFHIDHIHPRSFFTEAKLNKRGIVGEEQSFYLESVDTLPNLQLLEGVPNQEKSDTDFEDWLNAAYRSKHSRQAFSERNYIPEVSLEFKNFAQFFKKRRELIFDELAGLLKPESTSREALAAN
ncbi:MAG: GmrSD restriction endonuclease domain-containing protein [Candidatus Sulfotelmatobacter sp.]